MYEAPSDRGYMPGAGDEPVRPVDGGYMPGAGDEPRRPGNSMPGAGYEPQRPLGTPRDTAPRVVVPVEDLSGFEAQVSMLEQQSEKLQIDLRSEAQKATYFQEELNALLRTQEEYAARQHGIQSMQHEVMRLNADRASLTEQAAALRRENMARQAAQFAKQSEIAAAAAAAAKQLEEECSRLQSELRMVEGDNEILRQKADALIGSVPQPTDNAAGQELIDRLRGEIQALAEDNLECRRSIKLGRVQPPRVDVAFEEKLFQKPKVEVKLVELENQGKINQLLTSKKELERDLERRENDWRSKYEQLAKQPPKVDVKTVEVESPKKIQELLETVNSKEAELTQIKRLLVAQDQCPPSHDVQYVDKEYVVEVPQVDMQHIHFEDADRLAAMQRALEIKGQQLQHTLEMTNSVEAQLRDALTLDEAEARRGYARPKNVLSTQRQLSSNVSVLNTPPRTAPPTNSSKTYVPLTTAGGQ